MCALHLMAEADAKDGAVSRVRVDYPVLFADDRTAVGFN